MTSPYTQIFKRRRIQVKIYALPSISFDNFITAKELFQRATNLKFSLHTLSLIPSRPQREFIYSVNNWKMYELSRMETIIRK